jgi:hypothetical protein
MQLLKKLLALGIFLGIAVTTVSDVGQYLTARYYLSNATRDAAEASASRAYRNNDRNASWQAGEDVARAQGATVYGYDMTDNSVHVWTRRTVPNTWAVHYISNYLEHEQLKSPLVIDDEGTAIIR